MLSRAEGVTYLSDAEFVGQSLPGPHAYNPNDEQTRSKSPSVRFIKPSAEKRSYKIVKSNEPDVGTYDAAKSKDKIQSNGSVVYIGRPKGQQNSARVSFTKQMTSLKKFVPGVGSYKPNY